MAGQIATNTAGAPPAVEALRRPAPAPLVPTIRVQRIALPRYQVEYLEADAALAMAKKLRDTRMLAMAFVIPGDVGGELVLDLALSGEPLQVGLFFRILQRSATASVFEWIPRRTTDSDLLDLWLHAIELRMRPPSRNLALASQEADLGRALETCRRALQRNPFTALKVHWTASERDLNAAADALTTELTALQRRSGLAPSVAELVAKALEEVGKTRAMVSTADGRRKARSVFVPVDQIRQAIELASSKADLARMRNDMTELAQARAELTELGTSLPR